jgi:hypothetical protein
MAGCCEYGIEPSRSIKDVEFLNWLSVLLSPRRTLVHGVDLAISGHALPLPVIV